MDCAPTGQRSTPTVVTSVPHWSYLLLWPVQIQHDLHFIWTWCLHVISCTRNRIPRVSNLTLEGQEPLLHASAVVPLERESAKYLLETVPCICRKMLPGSTGQSSTDLLEIVPGIERKQFQLSTGKSSRYLFERVSGIYLKNFQVPTG